MGMDLLSNHGYERFSLRTWHECLKCAIEFGWKPEGTIAPTGFVAEWNGSYYGNNCQTVIVMPALWQRRFFVQLLRFRQAEVRARRARFRVIPAHQVDPAQLECDRAREGLFQEEDEQISWIRRLRGLADFALKGGIVIA